MLDTKPSQQVPEAPSVISEEMHLVNFFPLLVGGGAREAC